MATIGVFIHTGVQDPTGVLTMVYGILLDLDVVDGDMVDILAGEVEDFTKEDMAGIGDMEDDLGIERMVDVEGAMEEGAQEGAEGEEYKKDSC